MESHSFKLNQEDIGLWMNDILNCLEFILPTLCDSEA